ncbi:MAG: AmmeMemoRadiSam system protein A [Polyangiales bacterium]
MLDDATLSTLATFARACIREALGGAPAEVPRGGVYDEPAATFVTVHHADGELQGCIGRLAASRPLTADVRANALAAAFLDARGTSLALDDVDGLDVEVSVLSPTERVAFDGSERGARAALRPGVDGVLMEVGHHHGTFLPQMWEHFREPREFLDQLKVKSGLSARFWSPDVALFRYTVQAGRSPSNTPREAAP